MVEVLLVLAAVGAGLVAVMRMDVRPRAEDPVAAGVDRPTGRAATSPEAGEQTPAG